MADDELAIVPQTEKVVDFYGDPIPVAQDADGSIYVPLRPLATFLGLDPSGQRQRVQRDRVLAKRLNQVMMKGTDGKMYSQLCLPLDLLPGWLFSITTARVAPELQDKLDRYREQCFTVLWDAFKGDIMPIATPSSGLTAAEQILAQAEAIAALARQQVEFERRYSTMAGYMRGFIHETRQRLEKHEEQLNIQEHHLTGLEVRLDPASALTEEQANEIALAVKNVAYALGGSSQDYGKVYSELYRRYRITSYKNLPCNRYDDALAWLGQWYNDIEQKK